MAREYRALIVRDQTGFEKSYADLVEVIIKESEELYHLDSYLRNLNATLAERQQQIALRTTEVEKATTALDVTTKNAQTELKKLNDVQYDLFQLQQRVGIAIQKNHELEVELRNLEAKKPGL
jgi:DNA repair exonuclease SbcCD ATPase subunit